MLEVLQHSDELTETGERQQPSETQYRLLFDSNPHPMWVYDLETSRFLTVNAAACEHYGYSEAQFLAMTIRDIRPAEDLPALQAAGLQKQGKRFVLLRHRKQDGTDISVEISSDRIVYNGRAARLVLAHDVTKRVQAEARIQHLNRLHAMLSRVNGLTVRARDREHLFAEACRIAVEVGGYKVAWIGMVDPHTLDGKAVAYHGIESDVADKIRLTAREGTPYSEQVACRAIRQSLPVVCNDVSIDPTMAQFRDEMLQRGHNSVGCFPLTVAGRTEAVLALSSEGIGTFDDEENGLIVELARDISFALDHLKKQEQLHYLAYYDELTGLANRRLFLERAAQHLRSAVSDGHNVALGLIDLERFKNVNHSLGRPAGDALLKQVAAWLTHHMGGAALLARMDADRFAVIIPEVRQDDHAERLLEKTLESLAHHPFPLQDLVVRVAAKAGLALFPDNGTDADTVFKNAEAALGKAKVRGDRCLLYAQKMTDTLVGRHSQEFRLRAALDNEEFVLHYQPKVSFRNGELTGAEALIRWNDPLAGLVPPGRFIPLLEETGLIRDVGRWAMNRAIADYLRRLKTGLTPTRIAVNVSALQLRHRDFVGEVKQAIAVDPQAAAGLELEITESLIMEDLQHTVATLKAIRAMGVSIAIDDFGIGFSSLSCLAKLPLDTLKIDRSFVNDMTNGSDGLALVSTIINLAHSLKLKVVAEGVETDEQSRLLRLLNCDEMQGYLISKPVASEVFEATYLARCLPDEGVLPRLHGRLS